MTKTVLAGQGGKMEMTRDDRGLKSGWMTITAIAQRIGVTPKTIMRWEKAGKVNRAKRDWRGWRVYENDDLKELRLFKDTIVY